MPFLFPFPAVGGAASASGMLSTSSPLPLPSPQADACGGPPVVPKIFFNDTFPLICGLCALWTCAEGNSGNADFDNFGGGGRFAPELEATAGLLLLELPRTSTVLPRELEAAADHGVDR